MPFGHYTEKSNQRFHSVQLAGLLPAVRNVKALNVTVHTKIVYRKRTFVADIIKYRFIGVCEGFNIMT